MSGKVPLSRQAQLRKAVTLYEDFTGHEAEEIGKVPFDIPDIAVVVGEVEALIYNTIRDGKAERYIHKFKAAARPLFAVSPDGKQILFIDGNYDFTERGIVDKS